MLFASSIYSILPDLKDRIEMCSCDLNLEVHQRLRMLLVGWNHIELFCTVSKT